MVAQQAPATSAAQERAAATGGRAASLRAISRDRAGTRRGGRWLVVEQRGCEPPVTIGRYPSWRPLAGGRAARLRAISRDRAGTRRGGRGLVVEQRACERSVETTLRRGVLPAA